MAIKSHIAGAIRRSSWNVAFAGLIALAASVKAAPTAGDAEQLAKEVANMGWILFAAKSASGDYDLFLSRPDGSGKRNLTQTPDWSEYGGRFSPDGKRLCGTANLNGRDWNVVSLEIETGKATQVSRNLSCTPDWFQGDAGRVIYSCRIPGVGNVYGWTALMQGTTDGKSRSLIYGESGRHIYYGCTSPDDKYALFSLPESDGGTDAEMAIVRVADGPIVVPDDFKQLKALYPDAKSGPVLRLKLAGFEPHWTYAEIGGK